MRSRRELFQETPSRRAKSRSSANGLALWLLGLDLNVLDAGYRGGRRGRHSAVCQTARNGPLEPLRLPRTTSQQAARSLKCSHGRRTVRPGSPTGGQCALSPIMGASLQCPISGELIENHDELPVCSRTKAGHGIVRDSCAQIVVEVQQQQRLFVGSEGTSRRLKVFGIKCLLRSEVDVRLGIAG